MTSAPASPLELLELIRKSGILSSAGLARLPTAEALPADLQQAAAVLVRDGLITKFQAGQLLQGRFKGFRIGSYLIRDILGRGGMGVVYLAEHADLRRKVALKVLVTGKNDNQKLAQERFLREARAAAALDHPNIVRMFDVSSHGPMPYLVMEYVEGQTLQQRLDAKGAIPFAEAVDFIAQAAAGLQHAHEQGFVHRDIKPANLILDRTGAIKLLDMGLARSAVDATDNLTERLDSGAVVGTADYIAPEQALSHAKVDGRADIYSLGASLFVLVSGKPPFEGPTAQKLLHHQMKAPPPLSELNPELPKGLTAVVAKMLAKKPEQRFPSAADVIAALAPWLGNSARVVAGLSRTHIGQTGEHVALRELAAASSRRLPPVDLYDSATVDPSRPAQDTGPVASAETTREAIRRGPETDAMPEPVPVARKSRKKVLIAAAVGVLVAAIGVTAALAGGGTKDDATPPADLPPAPPAAAVTEAAKPAVPPPVVVRLAEVAPAPRAVEPMDPVLAPGERLLARLDLTGLKAFRMRSGLTVPDLAKPNNKVHNLLSKSGANPPAGWTARCSNVNTQMEFIGEEEGRGALAVRTVKGPGSAMLFGPKFACPSGVCRLVVEYQAPLRDGAFKVRFKPDTGAAWDVVKPAVGGDEWRTLDHEVILRGAAGGHFEFHNTDDSPDAVLRVRSAAVIEVVKE